MRKKISPKKKPTTKKTSSKKRNVKKTSQKKVTPVPRAIATSKKEEATILTKIKGLFEDTATKIKTVLPGEAENVSKEPDQRESEIK